MNPSRGLYGGTVSSFVKTSSQTPPLRWICILMPFPDTRRSIGTQRRQRDRRPSSSLLDCSRPIDVRLAIAADGICTCVAAAAHDHSALRAAGACTLVDVPASGSRQLHFLQLRMILALSALSISSLISLSPRHFIVLYH